MESIKSLLDGMLQRHQITAQVTTARIIEATNESLVRILPHGRASDAVAISVRDGVILVHCRNSSAAELVSSRANAVLDTIKSTLPTAIVERIRTRIGT
ncbi:hypothetical protein A2348_02425 [Candidatus Uhrbacteria bacterium RIFOXYB12_FULL_58_10]|uniref:DUF721 domain-containing protein n=1 Tax=Candidatus Uhrbacteria bacterium RIFOXYB2_FULL_57_15 TaxID=1802422 RepID=A0A1F7W5Z8_9BACT|nr:MAG: hypothetical protein A2348_02425 [Candidatus Uhrbacteria bacterium RIFOXYB12_FULL_58_10]OGL98180.1 MAG: hypothetical protein A2304_03655 [Candidatus Uhrbacteria bacterium RIFOXYB2_FULL_57_15]OGL99330.1 MAG: hypothetical protein A2501_05310 [Candidatus Uhrbacteria bacterium RIFOXYC12_FULL_57_11]